MAKVSGGHKDARDIIESRLKRDLSSIYNLPTLPRDTPVANSPRLKIPLFPYQLRSLHRMLELEANPELGNIGKKSISTAGGVIADVVGMGKTAQILALFLASPAPAGQPNLVVVPQHLALQWHSEIHKFSDELKVHMVMTVEQAQGDAVCRMLEVVTWI